MDVPTSELHPWLTTAQARDELVAEVLERHRGSKGIKPTVAVVSPAAKKIDTPSEMTPTWTGIGQSRVGLAETADEQSR